MKKIEKLSSVTSHQLEAEQVIPDLAAAVKELVENSLDSNPIHLSNDSSQHDYCFYLFRHNICQLWTRFHNC
jgi:uncharacterized membrane protein